MIYDIRLLSSAPRGPWFFRWYDSSVKLNLFSNPVLYNTTNIRTHIFHTTLGLLNDCHRLCSCLCAMRSFLQRNLVHIYTNALKIIVSLIFFFSSFSLYFSPARGSSFRCLCVFQLIAGCHLKYYCWFFHLPRPSSYGSCYKENSYCWRKTGGTNPKVWAGIVHTCTV